MIVGFPLRLQACATFDEPGHWKQTGQGCATRSVIPVGRRDPQKRWCTPAKKSGQPVAGDAKGDSLSTLVPTRLSPGLGLVR